MNLREVDFFVAEKVLGIPCECPHTPASMCRVHDCALYSQDIQAAWVVAEKMDLFARPRLLEKYSDKWWVSECVLDQHRLLAFAPTAPLAICRAALKLVGIIIE
jgi:hypothetical protein